MENLINRTAGKFFSITFVKKDGTVRTMTARIGVHKHTSGKGLKFEPSERSLKVVWCCDAEAYRMVNLNSILKIKFRGVTHYNTVI